MVWRWYGAETSEGQESNEPAYPECTQLYEVHRLHLLCLQYRVKRSACVTSGAFHNAKRSIHGSSILRM